MPNATSAFGGGDPLSTCVWAQARVASVSWQMCTYPRSVDRWVSTAVQRTGCWLECRDVEWMLEVLSKAAQSHDPGRASDAELLDIGGNIGFYTLAAAAAGHRVNVFEPCVHTAPSHSSPQPRAPYVRAHSGTVI